MKQNAIRRHIKLRKSNKNVNGMKCNVIESLLVIRNTQIATNSPRASHVLRKVSIKCGKVLAMLNLKSLGNYVLVHLASGSTNRF